MRDHVPRLVGYRWEIPDENLEADFVEESRLALDSRHVPTRTDVAAIVGEIEEHRLEKFESMRAQQVAFVLAKRLLDRYFRAPDTSQEDGGQPGAERPWLFPRLIEITKRSAIPTARTTTATTGPVSTTPATSPMYTGVGCRDG